MDTSTSSEKEEKWQKKEITITQLSKCICLQAKGKRTQYKEFEIYILKLTYHISNHLSFSSGEGHLATPNRPIETCYYIHHHGSLLHMNVHKP